MHKVKPYMSNEEVFRAVQKHGEDGYEDLPEWLKHELIARNINFHRHTLRKKKYTTTTDYTSLPTGINKRIDICRKAIANPKATSQQIIEISKRLAKYISMQASITVEYFVTDTRNDPTELEQWDTVSDAREHRIMHKELTIKDYQDKYKRGKNITLIT
jgi:hypothetical protein